MPGAARRPGAAVASPSPAGWRERSARSPRLLSPPPRAASSARGALRRSSSCPPSPRIPDPSENGEGQNRTGDTTIFSRVLYQLSYLAGRPKASVRAVIRSVVAVGATVLVAASVSGATEQPPAPIQTPLPGPHFGVVDAGPFSMQGVERRIRPLGPGAPQWAGRLYRRSVRVLIDLTDPHSGALIAGERDGWDYVWPRDASAGAIALEAAGLRPEARRVVSFLSDIDTERAARFYSDGSPVPGRPAAGDAAGWIGAAERAVLPGAARSGTGQDGQAAWGDRQDYGENVTGDLLGNAIASGIRAPEIKGRFLSPRGLVREEGGDELDSAAAWAITLFPSWGLRGAIKTTLLAIVRGSTPY